MNAPALTLEELLAWSDATTRQWLRFLAENPALQELPCGIYGTANVIGAVRHIVAVELRYSQRLAGLPVTAYEEIPEGKLDFFAALHDEAINRFRQLLADPAQDWAEAIEFQTVSAGVLRASRRKILGHALLHGIRHWAQLSTLARAAGFKPEIDGDLLVSLALP